MSVRQGGSPLGGAACAMALTLALGAGLSLVGCGTKPPVKPTVGAAQLAERVKKATAEADPESRSLQLSKIALEYAKIKESTKTRETFSAARKAAEEIKEPANRVKQLSAVAAEQVDHDKAGAATTVDAAHKAVKDLPDSAEKAKVLATLAAARFKSGNKSGAAVFLKEAKELAAKLERPEEKIRTSLELAQGMFDMDDKATAEATAVDALTMAESLEDVRTKSEAIADVAVAQYKIAKGAESKATFEKSLEIADTIPDLGSKSFAFMKIGERMAANGMAKSSIDVLKKAEKYSEKISDGSVRNDFEAQLGALRTRLANQK